ncbi:tetratricopeptide repeat protein [Pseudomonadales bacterium]|nr:tetratricopeptide repeat protein [Pseudomonadales bacterium]MDB4151526.1 tetratricopeptide repeat protein [Pseudomonadales bacterium]
MTESHSRQAAGWLANLFKELKRRRVIRTATLYVVILWPIIQIVDILSPTLSLPDSTMRYLVTAFAAGLPLVLLSAWLFDLNQRGVVRDQGLNASASHAGSGAVPPEATALIGSRAELAMIVVMLLVVGGLFYAQLTLQESIGSPAVNAQAQERTIEVAKAVTKASSQLAVVNRIAVLPFESFTDDRRDRFFADGLSEELLNVLAGVHGLQVAARTSSFAYRGVRKSVQQIGSELGVDFILEGSVRRNDIDDTIRVTAQLVNTRDGAHLWSNTYDRQFTDVFKIQDDIAAAVVDELKIKLLGATPIDLVSRASASPEAIILYSMGQAELARRSEVSLQDAARFFQRAVDLDPDYVAAWVGLADANTLQVSYRFESASKNAVNDAYRDRLLADAQAAVDRGLKLNPQSGMAWASQGLIHRVRNHEDEAAKQALLKAIEYSPNYAMAHMWYAPLIDDPDAKLAEYEMAFKLDPRSPVAGYNVASLYIDRGRDAEAMQVFGSIIDANPNFALAYRLSARVSQARGRISDAIRQYEKAYGLSGSVHVAFDLAKLQLSLGNYRQADEWISVAKATAEPQHMWRFDWLEVQRYAMQEDFDQAQTVLQRLAQSSGLGEPNQSAHEHYLMASYASYLIGEPQAAIDYWQQAQGLEDRNRQGGDLEQFAMLGTVYAYQQSGQLEAGAALLNVAKTELDTVLAGTARADPSVWYRQALANQLAGQQQMALMSLQRGIDEGWVAFWQPPIEPILRDMAVQPEFQTMMAGLQTRINLSRDQYALEQSFAATPNAGGSGSE